MRHCAECGTEMEVHVESADPGNIQSGILVWYCPTCKAGCGELTDKENEAYHILND